MRIFFLLLTMVLFSYSQLSNLNGISICIDPGHGGANPSNDRQIIIAPGITFWESEGNFQKALHLRTLLQKKGATVFLTRETNSYPNDSDEPSLSARWSYANSKNVNWFHSIHSNAGGGSYTMVLLKEIIATRLPAFSQAVTMSSYIYTNIRSKLRTTASGGNISGYPGVYKDYTFYGGPSGGYNLGVLSGLTMPGELSEGSFHDGMPEARRLMNNSYRKMEAYGIYSAILQYYNVTVDPVGIIAGIVTNSDLGAPQNLLTVRLMPENRVYNGDDIGNGFYMFDSVAPGPHTLYFETAGNQKDSASVTVTANGTHFVDKSVRENNTPYVYSAIPAYGDTNIAYNASIKISFSKPMDTASVRKGFSFTPSIPGTVRWENSNRTAVFSAIPFFSYSTIYTLTLDTTIRSVNGYGLDGNADGISGDQYTFTFKTQRPIAPVITSTVPAKGDTAVSSVSTVRINFSNMMDTAAVRSAFAVNPPMNGSIAWEGNNTFVFTPKGFWSFSTQYTVTMSGSALSETSLPLDGNKDGTGGDAYSFSFTIQKQVPPYVTLTSPKNNDTNITTVNTLIGIKFSKAMDTTSLKNNFSITPAVTGTFTFSADRLVIYFKAAAPLEYSTEYTVAMSGSAVSFDNVQLDGNNDGTIGDAFTYKFKTKANPLSVREHPTVPVKNDLSQNYPNPFNPTTAISFSILAPSRVTIRIFDALGREVALLLDAEMSAGEYTLPWDASSFPSGMYLYRLTSEHFSSVKRMMLVK
jgi:N-acetylmuramoyl-L-alanine amidase